MGLAALSQRQELSPSQHLEEIQISKTYHNKESGTRVSEPDGMFLLHSRGGEWQGLGGLAPHIHFGVTA